MLNRFMFRGNINKSSSVYVREGEFLGKICLSGLDSKNYLNTHPRMTLIENPIDDPNSCL